MKTRRQKLLQFVAQNAMVGFAALAPLERADLLEGLALILPKHEASLARHTAGLIRQAEDHQLKFGELLKEGK